MDDLDMERAKVLMGVWGESSYPLDRWRGKVYTTDGKPDWCDDLPEDGEYVRVLASGLGNNEAPEGYRLAVSFDCGEASCPWCDGSGTVDVEGDRDPITCQLCEGNGAIYWGGGWGVYVYERIPAPMEWLVAELAEVRRDEAALAEPDDEGQLWTHVRLQVLTFATGDEVHSAVLHTGDPSYDTNHNGYWGASIVDAEHTDDDLESIAADLWREAWEAFELAQADESEGA